MRTKPASNRMEQGAPDKMDPACTGNPPTFLEFVEKCLKVFKIPSASAQGILKTEKMLGMKFLSFRSCLRGAWTSTGRIVASRALARNLDSMPADKMHGPQDHWVSACKCYCAKNCPVMRIDFVGSLFVVTGSN